ncbi:MAG TPA: TIGR01459 family HAD-type hydrolase [Xanthobacteraceae bacterium]|jgi:HAD superfamily hydrolase (TIGR01459 family)|nr:TIGR01459 family HAD-type hydrolase [Xanthobacteraceae bacterium]
MSISSPPFTAHFATLASAYDVVLCDVWGVVHNSIVSFADATTALTRFRAQSGTVVLITNAPRRSEVVMRILDDLKVPRESYDAIVSSGDVTRAIIAARTGQSAFHIGPARDHSMFEDLDTPRVPLETADYVVCSGLYDDTTETPQDYKALIADMRARQLTMVCANPDIVVERGEKLVYCAGAIADLYAAAGGEVVYAGKPYRPIYEQAVAVAASRRGGEIKPARILAIGDSIHTDLKGAAAFGIDCLFVTCGIHAEELGGRERPDRAALDQAFAASGLAPKAVMQRLVW